MKNRLKLYGFDNLTKSLSSNIYNVCYTRSEREQRDYIAYIDEQYSSERLTEILERVTGMIGAHVLNISAQDYDPQDAGIAFLITEEPMLAGRRADTRTELSGETMAAHLDKSHVTVHTCLEYHPDTFLATFRVDIDIATCGEITPLSTLDHLIGSFDSNIVTMGYHVRSFTHDVTDKELFTNHKMASIRDFIDNETLRKYNAIDLNVYRSNLFHTKVLIKDVNLQDYLFNTDVYEPPPQARLRITDGLRREMIEIFTGNNVY